MAQLPRGIRNNNPLNIRRSLQKWQGERDFQTDRDFVEFQSMSWGYRAALICIRTYIHKYNIDSIGRIIHRWAPSTENDTNAYVKAVCAYTGFQPSTPIKFEERIKVCKLVAAMAQVECGRKFPILDILKVYDKLLSHSDCF